MASHSRSKRTAAKEPLHAPEPYNPLDKRNLGKSVADALIASDPRPLAGRKTFLGAGIYALYYTGNFEPYGPLAAMNRDQKFSAPIYVGQAAPKGAREGRVGLDEDAGAALHERLRGHALSIRKADNLEISDFFCRYIVTEDIWLSLGESLMIKTFQPVWNVVLNGFGSNRVGEGRGKQKRSRWDTLHPGRKVTPSMVTIFEVPVLIENIREHLLKTLPRLENLGQVEA